MIIKHGRHMLLLLLLLLVEWEIQLGRDWLLNDKPACNESDAERL